MRVFGSILLVLAISFNCLAQETLGFRILDGKRKVKIPFELHNNLIIIPVVLNDILPLRFILDTGVRTAILTDKDYSDLINLNYSKKYTITGVGNKQKVNAYITNNVKIALPGLEGKGHAMLVLEEDLLELKNYLGIQVHGILGYELFSRFVVKVNYSNQMITLSDPQTYRFPRRYDKVQMDVEDTKPYINATIIQDDGSEMEIRLMVDSGSSQSLLLDTESSECLKLPEERINAYVGRGLGGPIEGSVGRLESFNLGSYRLKNPIANFPDNPNFYDSLKYPLAFRNGTLGGEILSRFNIIFNFAEQEFYFKKNRLFKKPFTYNMSGLVVKAKGPYLKTFEITDVRKNSAGGDAGVKPGDVILSINGQRVDGLELQNIIGLLNEKPNKKIFLRVKRGEDVLLIKFRLKSLI